MPADDWDYTQGHATDEEYVRADFSYDGIVVPDVAVRPKGYSSLALLTRERGSSHRLSLKVDFNFFNSARTLHGVKKVNLNNGFGDPSLIREAASYQLFHEMGIAAPRTAFVDLWVNDTHLGLYTMVEQIDRTFLAHNFGDAGGNLYKPSAPAAFLKWTREDVGNWDASRLTDVGYDGVNVGREARGDSARATTARAGCPRSESAV